MRFMLLDFWYPLAFSGELRRRPRRVEALGRQFVVWRTGTGRVAVLSDLSIELQAAYRRRRRELIAAGWPTTGAPEDAGPIRVIGSPARRDPALNRAWVDRT